MKIAITGHRPQKLGHDYDLVSPLIKKIEKEISKQFSINDITYGITGMALGIDTLFANMCLDRRIPYIAAIPFNGQHLKWPFKSRERYLHLLNHAAEVVNVSGDDKYKVEYMDLRNKWMVDNCDKLISVWDGSPGGTANCNRYAEKIGREIIQINPKKL